MSNGSNDLADTPTPSSKVRIGRLDTLSGIRRELGRVYREARRGELNANTASKFAFILASLQKFLEVEEIEQRIKALEDKSRA